MCIRDSLRRDIHVGMTTAIKKYLITKFSPIPENVNHDSWFVPLAAAFGIKGALLKEPLVKYRQHNTQLFGGSKKNLRTKLYNFLEPNNILLRKKIYLFETYLKVIKAHSYSDENLATKELKQIILHYKHKINISKYPRIQRINHILKEIINRNYNKYGSLNNILFDLLKNIEKEINQY